MAGSNGEAVQMDFGVAARLNAKLGRHREAFHAMASDVKDIMNALDAGAGEFATTMEPGSGAFGASWSEAVVRSERSAEVMAKNIIQFGTDMESLDLGAFVVR